MTRLRLASATAVAYIVVVFGGTLVQFALGGGAFTLRFSLSQPAVWLAALLAGLVAWGLWRQYKWAWWLGMVAGGYQLFRVSAPMVERFSFSRPSAFGPLLVAGLLLVFLILLFPSKVRASCNR
ncbi:hypothetical protein [Azoarcus sp. KH32C]|uniref:hypothetical protein n=1 Tax=Azoarcus sp. KH32C TaxID=748247 RepID=UPI000238605E|nr:hypothetical protein [Azoarcus sp. KH32C]BAL25649.1 hypothetical protein AZKH_3360 [Azoarcus sp. KH32C]